VKSSVCVVFLPDDGCSCVGNRRASDSPYFSCLTWKKKCRGIGLVVFAFGLKGASLKALHRLSL